MKIGYLCAKNSGRDAGKECIIVDIVDKTFVIIDGNTRRRKCNMCHLEYLGKIADIKAKADHETVMKALDKLGVKAEIKRKKEKSSTAEKKETAVKEKKSLLKRKKKE